MKIATYEKAIEALKYPIELDEVVCRHGHVHRFYGHTKNTMIMWDDFGKAVSLTLTPDEKKRTSTDTEQIKSKLHRMGVRDVRFDLRLV